MVYILAKTVNILSTCFLILDLKEIFKLSFNLPSFTFNSSFAKNGGKNKTLE